VKAVNTTPRIIFAYLAITDPFQIPGNNRSGTDPLLFGEEEFFSGGKQLRVPSITT
jgi:hypothetical protein